MGQLQDIAGIGDSITYPGHTLSPPRLIEHAEAEAQCEADYVLNVHKATCGFPAAESAVYRQRVADNLRVPAAFHWGTPFFDSWLFSMRAFPFVAYLLMRRKEPEINMATVTDIVANTSLAQMNTVYAMWGYSPKKDGGAGSQKQPPTGSQSSATSQMPPPKAEDGTLNKSSA